MLDVAPKIGLFSAILLIGVSQGFFLVIAILAAPKRADNANRFLIALVLAFVVELLFRFAIDTGHLRAFPRALVLHWALDVWFGPLLYLYTCHLARPPSGALETSIGRHFVLPLAGTAAAVSLWPVYGRADILEVAYGSAPVLLEVIELVLAFVGLASMVYYLTRSFSALRVHRDRVAQNYSFSGRIALVWLRNLLLVVATLLALYVPLTISGWFAEDFDRAYGVSVVLAVFGIGFLGIRQPDLFVRVSDISADFVSVATDARDAATQKYLKSALSDSEVSSIFAAINELMDVEQLYLEPDLSLPRLADALGLSSHYISQAINQGSGSNFFDFVNKRRVNHVAESLKASAAARAVNILEIAMDAGFSSKSAFYAAFRSHMGQTPVQFRKSVVSD